MSPEEGNGPKGARSETSRRSSPLQQMGHHIAPLCARVCLRDVVSLSSSKRGTTEHKCVRAGLKSVRDQAGAVAATHALR